MSRSYLLMQSVAIVLFLSPSIVMLVFGSPWIFVVISSIISLILIAVSFIKTKISDIIIIIIPILFLSIAGVLYCVYLFENNQEMFIDVVAVLAFFILIYAILIGLGSMLVLLSRYKDRQKDKSIAMIDEIKLHELSNDDSSGG